MDGCFKAAWWCRGPHDPVARLARRPPMSLSGETSGITGRRFHRPDWTEKGSGPIVIVLRPRGCPTRHARGLCVIERRGWRGVVMHSAAAAVNPTAWHAVPLRRYRRSNFPGHDLAPPRTPRAAGSRFSWVKCPAQVAGKDRWSDTITRSRGGIGTVCTE
jgi:hypothetical protein